MSLSINPDKLTVSLIDDDNGQVAHTVDFDNIDDFNEFVTKWKKDNTSAEELGEVTELDFE